MIREHIKLAFSNFCKNKMRTLLSLLGILIGVASVILITTLGRSATASVRQDISREGMDLVTVHRGWAADPRPELYDPAAGAAAAEEVPGVLRTAVTALASGTVRSPYEKANSELQLVPPAFFSMHRFEAAAGELFPEDREDYAEDRVILGSEAARTLFPYGYATGQSLSVLFEGGIFRQYVVAAVLKKTGGGFSGGQDNAVYLPYANYDRRVGKITQGGSWLFQAVSPEEGVRVSRALEEWFAAYAEDPNGFYVVSASSISDMYESVSRTLSLVLGGIAAISLLVGGIGIMNIMLVSVTERIKEIGIRSALGAAPADIRTQFLVEAVCLTLCGGILGILSGAVLGWGATRLAQWPFQPSLPAYLITLGFSMVVGLFFGLYPAFKASSLNPIEALNRE